MKTWLRVAPCWRWRVVAAISAAVCVNFAAAQTRAADADMTWALRFSGGHLIYLVEHSSVAVRAAPGFLPTQIDHVPGLGNPRLRCICFFEAMPMPSGAATQPTQVKAPDPSQLLPVRRMKYTIAPDSPITSSSEPGFAYVVHFTCENHVPEAAPALECARPVGNQLLVGCAIYEHDDATSKAGAERSLIAMMKSAVQTARRPVRPNHYEDGSTLTRDQAKAFVRSMSQGTPDDTPLTDQPPLEAQPEPATHPNVPGAGNASAPATQPLAAQRSAAPTANPAVKAASELTMAEDYLSVGKTDIARIRLQAIVARYPNTPAAKTAQEHLADLDAAGK